MTPRPLRFIEEIGDCYIIVMEYLNGSRLCDIQNITTIELCALANVLKTFNSLPVRTSSYTLQPVICNSSCMLSKVREFFGNHENIRFQQTSEAWDLARNWVFSKEAEHLKYAGEQVFSRGDPNLANCLWDGNTVRVVDFEYAGSTDKAYDLVDFVEHVDSRKIGEDSWRWFIEQFELSKREVVRFVNSRKLASLFWLCKFWPTSESDGDYTAFNNQFNRVRALFN
uniref:phosphotransferase n=1 Tax=Paenibacillus allorhizosphaerae TaxID=2849866 RepID=UPI0038B2EAA0